MRSVGGVTAGWLLATIIPSLALAWRVFCHRMFRVAALAYTVRLVEDLPTHHIDTHIHRRPT